MTFLGKNFYDKTNILTVINGYIKAFEYVSNKQIN